MNTDQPTPIDKMSFEEALRELEALVRQLEDGKVELEQAISTYERAAKLRTHCETKLRSARTRVEQIVSGANGEVTTQDVDLEAS